MFVDNPVMEAGKTMHQDLHKLKWASCGNCKESGIMELIKNGNCALCQKKDRREMFGEKNNLIPTPAPECLRRLTPIEKSAISLICPSISLYKKGSRCWNVPVILQL
jgi:hypothetical protein